MPIVIKAYRVGTRITYHAEIRNKLKALFDPDTVKLTVLNPAGSKELDAVSMIKQSVGIYEYIQQTADNYTAGERISWVDITQGANTDRMLKTVAHKLVA